MKTETPTDISVGASAGAPAPSSTAKGAEGAEIVVALADRFEILARQRFDATDRPFQDCFRARRVGQTQADFLAVAAGIMPLARAEAFAAVKAIDRAGLLRLLDWGTVDWPGGDRRLALIFTRPAGPQLLKRMDDVRMPMNDEELTRALLNPAHGVLTDMHAKGLFHGAIRPTNIFYNSVPNATGILGECVSSLPSFLQPALCETIERGLTEPAARGSGTVADDIYSLGITAAIMALGHNPLKGIPDDAMIETKIERGSYAAIVGGARIPSALIEPLRGMLSDDPLQRWTLDDLGKWIGGRRQNPRQPTPAKRSTRPIQVGEREIWSVRSLAVALSRDVPTGAKLVENGEIDRWVRRVVGDAACATLVADTVESTSGQGRGGTAFEEKLISRVCQALDPAAPIRFRGRSVMPRGVGGALAYHTARGESLQILGELIASGLPQFWYTMQPRVPSEGPGGIKSFDQARGFLERNGLGYGIERCLYEMMPTAPCLSEITSRHYAVTAASLLQALESVAGNAGKRPTAPLDRHIAAFIATRDRSIGDALLNALTAGSEGEKRLAMLNILSGIQNRSGPKALPKLCEWFAGLMGVIVDRFHSRDARKQTMKEVVSAAAHGILGDLQRLVDDPQVIARDERGFGYAQADYGRLAEEAGRLVQLATNRTVLEQSVGRETAAVVASAVGLLLAASIVLLELGM